MKTKLLIMVQFLVIYFGAAGTLLSQISIQDQLKSQLQSFYNKSFDVNVMLLDTLLGKRTSRGLGWNEVINNPYKTLNGYYIFSANPIKNGYPMKDSVVFGFFKNNQIIWSTGPTMSGDWDGIFGATDLNADGEVDIMTTWSYWWSQRERISYMWIFSWNGSQGRVLNEIDSVYNQSIIMAVEGLFEVLDGANNLKKIRAEWDVENEKINSFFPPIAVSTLPYVTYSWNGLKYTISTESDQVSGTTFLPANKLNVSLSASCKIGTDSNKFSYFFSNNVSSQQNIAIIYLDSKNTVTSINQPTNWLGTVGMWDLQGVYWMIDPRIPEGYKDVSVNMIRPGQVGNFFIYSNGLLGITKYYIQGNTKIPYNLTEQDYQNDLVTNSVSGYTIAPVDTPKPFNPLNFLDTLTSYTTQARSLGWIKIQATADKYLDYYSSARTKLVQHDSVGARSVLLNVLNDVNIDSTASLSSEAYALLRFNTEYLISKLPQTQAAPFFAAKLVSSAGVKLTTGSLQYYEGSWKDATNNQNGTFSINTNLKTLSLRMTYENGSQTKSNVSISNDTIVFQTVNTQVQLQNSQGAFIDTGTVQYYAGAWRTLGTTTNGVATKELLPASYSFRMTYVFASKDKQQDIGINPTVVFQTINTAVQLQNSQGTLIDQGTVQYYSGAWRDFGSTTNGVANKELLPNNYSFRMTYAYASKDKQQDIGTNATVIFQTVNAAVQLQNSQGSLIDQGTVQYYSGAWQSFGTTTNGVANKELLPNNYSFRMSYAYASKDKQQDISSNPTVVFQTVNAQVQLMNSQGNLIDQGSVQYYSGAWRPFGITTNGIAAKELLPNSYSFRMSYEYVSLDKAQDVTTNNTVSFTTVLCTIQVKNSQNQLVGNAMASYYSGAWRQIGNTVNGIITKELLPVNLSFRVKYGTQQQDKQQNLLTNNIVEFIIP